MWNGKRVRECSPRLVHYNYKAHLEYSEKQQLEYRHPYEMSEEDLKLSRSQDMGTLRTTILQRHDINKLES